MGSRSPALLGVLLLPLLAACPSRGGGTPAYGLLQRTQVQGLTFPTGLPSPSPVQFTDAFPSLTFDRPLFLTAPPDGTDRIVVVEQPGLVRIFPNSPATSATTTYLDLTGAVQFGGEEGLLGFTFHPDYATNGWFYVFYTAGGPRRSVLSRFQVSAGDPNVANPASELILLTINQPFSNHNSGSLCFGPDGKLYVASGDGGSGGDPFNNAQDLTNLLGKILRLESDGTVPVDNPFVGGLAGERGEIWAYGLRNPWRTSFDRATGTLWAGDVGQNAIEEVDVIRRGRNYGWRLFEGNQTFHNPNALPAASFEAPVHTYGRSQGYSVTGGYVYRGSAVPDLNGAYVYADFGSGRVWALVYDGVQMVSNTEVAAVSTPASFGEDQAGELYVCCFDGRVRRLVQRSGGPAPVLPVTLSATGLFADLATLEPVPGVLEYQVNAELWSDQARKRRFLALPGTARILLDATEAWDFPVGTVLVKHFEIDVDVGVTRRLETRVLLRHDTGWQGYTYRWNAMATDADLVADTGDSDTFMVQDPVTGPRSQTWRFPSRAECMTCHTGASGRVLGVRTRQLNRDFAFPLRVDNQLRTWNHIGLFTTDAGDHLQYEAYPDPGDATAALAARARAYLAVNCGMCHLPLGPTPVDLDLRYGIDVTALQAVGVAATSAVPGGAGVRITAGDRNLSDLWLRMGLRDAYGMPPLGSSLLDDAALLLIGSWIAAGAGN